MISFLKSNYNTRFRIPIWVLPLVFGGLLFGGCEQLLKSKNDDRVLARVHKKSLYESNIATAIPRGLSPQDSVNAVQNVINNWVRQQLLLHEAEANLTESQKDFSKLLENYRNSLVIYEFESKIVRDRLDTIVSKQEIQDYYSANMTDFELKENILKANYVQIDAESKELRKLRNHWKKGDPADKTALRQYCRKNGLNYSFDNNEWVYFNDFITEVPIRTYNQEEFLKYNRNFEVRDSLSIYFVEIKDFKIKESVAPLSLNENIIRNILLNRRKLELLQKTQDEIYEAGVKNNYFEIY